MLLVIGDRLMNKNQLTDRSTNKPLIELRACALNCLMENLQTVTIISKKTSLMQLEITN